MAGSGSGRKFNILTGGDQGLLFPVDPVNEDLVQPQIRYVELSVPVSRKMTVRYRLTVGPRAMALMLNLAEKMKTAVLQNAEDRNIPFAIARAVDQIFLLGDGNMAGSNPARSEAGKLPVSPLCEEKRNDRSPLSRPLKCVKDPVFAFFQGAQICGG